MLYKITKQHPLKDPKVRAQILAAHLKQQDKRERVFINRLRPLFDKQQEEVEAKLVFLRGIRDIIKLVVTKRINDVLFDKELAVQAFIAFERPLLTQTMLDGVKDTFAFTGEDPERFDLQRRKVTSYLRRQSQQFASKVNDTTLDALRAELQTGVRNGESLEQIRTRVGGVFNSARGFRAERIARTEVGSAFNFGQQEAYVQSDRIEQKQWLTARDSRVRGNKPTDEFSHVAADGQEVAKGRRFEVGGERLLFPRDPAGSAGNIINCRCTTLPVF